MVKNIFCCAAIAAFVLFGTVGCKSTTLEEDTSPVPEAMDDPNGFNSRGGDAFGGGAGTGKWQEGGNAGEADANGWVPADPSGNNLGIPVIYFAYDSNELDAENRAKLDRIAEFVNPKADLALVIEGHCDTRGTDEYNRALGERRANAVRAYLAEKGLSDARMRTISYGEDKPAVQGSTPEAHQQNRRGVLVPMRMTR